MRNFQDTFETRKRSFISAFSICMTVPLRRNADLSVTRARGENKYRHKLLKTHLQKAFGLLRPKGKPRNQFIY